jgi:hypothetical protein
VAAGRQAANICISVTRRTANPYDRRMALFGRGRREPRDYNDPHLDDAAWLRSCEARYSSLVHKHYGSPDTIAAGGRLQEQAGDVGSALFFYQKAIDVLHTNYVIPMGSRPPGPAGWVRQPSSRDLDIVDAYLRALHQVRALRPAAQPTNSVTEVTHRLRTISSAFKRHGLDARPYLDRLAVLGQLAPDVDVSGVFWS